MRRRRSFRKMRLKAWQRVSLLAVAVCLPARLPAQVAAPQAIRIWGHGHRGEDYILTLLRAWQEGYRKTHPEARFEDELDGNASAIGGLFTGAADLAILDREASFIEVDAYQQGAGYDPFRVPVARGSVALRHHAPALVLYTHPDNPLRQLTLDQVDAIFDADHRRGGRRLTTWGDLGLTGEWAHRAIDLYTYTLESAEVQFFERAAMMGSQKFSCCLRMFDAGAAGTAEAQIAAALRKDRYGLALSTLPAPGLRALALSSGEGAPAVQPTPETIAAETYPLGRTVYIYANRRPHAAVPAKVAGFLDFIVSPAGQTIVASTGGYVALSPGLAAKAREALR